MGSNMLPGYRNIQRTYKRNHVVPRTDDLMPQEQIPLLFLGFEARNVCFNGSTPVNRRHPAPADSQDIPPVFIYGFLILHLWSSSRLQDRAFSRRPRKEGKNASPAECVNQNNSIGGLQHI